MKSTIKFGALLLLLFFISGNVMANVSEVTVVASTTWVGAMVKAAGVENVTVLAPADMKHPAEYDFRPSDIQKALQADFIVWAGYEGFIPRLVEAAGIPHKKVLRALTNNNPSVLRNSVKTLAEVFGTEEKYSSWVAKLDALANRLKEMAVINEVGSIPVAVQMHQKSFVEFLGYDIAASFGPGELTIGGMMEIKKKPIKIIIDNWHSAQGEPLKEEGIQYVSLINFPGPFGTQSLLDVIEYNAKQLNLDPNS